jgi:ABC-2 type transport system permease protein
MIATIIWELRQRKTAILWWTIGSVVLSAVILFLYPSIHDKASQLNEAINQLPAGIRQLKTGGANAVNVADPVSFLNSQLFYATLPILWIILAVTRGSATLGRDEQNHTLELLLARPISRSRLLFAKAISLLAEFAIIGGLTLLAITALCPTFDLRIASGRLALAALYTILFSLSFGMIAFALQAAGGLTRRAASAIAVVAGFGGYLLASLSGLTDWLKIPAKLAPYHYFAPDKILHGQTVTGLNVYLIGICAVAIAVSYLGFRRRDIE